MSDSEAHNHAGDHEYYRRLVVKYAKLCSIAHNEIFKPPGSKRNRTVCPSKAFVLFGPAGPEVVMFDFEGDHAFTLSTSCPSMKYNGALEDSLRKQAQKIREAAMTKRVEDMGYGEWIVGQGNPAGGDHEDHGDASKYPPGQCGESIPFAEYVTKI